MMTRSNVLSHSRAARAMLIVLATFVIAVFGSRHGVAADALPGNSIYRLDVALVDQDGTASHLADRQGKPVLISMFYSSCQFVCPMIIDTLKKTERTLDADDRREVDVLLVSFDPAKDTPERLKAVAAQHKLDTPRWSLARTEAEQVRKLAALLDIQYRALGDGDFNHSSVLILLDPQGRIVARSDKLGEVDPALAAALKRAVAAPTSD